MSPRRLLAAISLLALILLPFQAALATIITFENATGGPLGTNFSPLTSTTCGASGLGDFVGSAVQGSCSYGNGGEGFTPNVGVEFLATHAINVGPIGDLANVGFKQLSGQIQIMLTADVDFEVELLGFDIGFTRGEIGAVQVRDGETNDLLFNDFFFVAMGLCLAAILVASLMAWNSSRQIE